MKNINVYENFLSMTEIEYLNEYIKKSVNYGHTSGNRDRIINVFFSHHIIDKFINVEILNKIKLITKMNLKLVRNYFHIQTYGLDGMFHEDSMNENSYTFCIYLNEIEENSGGEFYIKLPETKHIICIETKYNSGIFFPATYLHKGNAYNRNVTKPRHCITWKLESD